MSDLSKGFTGDCGVWSGVYEEYLKLVDKKEMLDYIMEQFDELIKNGYERVQLNELKRLSAELDDNLMETDGFNDSIRKYEKARVLQKLE